MSSLIIAQAYNQLGLIFLKESKLDDAIKNFQLSLEES